MFSILSRCEISQVAAARNSIICDDGLMLRKNKDEGGLALYSNSGVCMGHFKNSPVADCFCLDFFNKEFPGPEYAKSNKNKCQEYCCSTNDVYRAIKLGDYKYDC
jgi:hypothetical protein